MSDTESGEAPWPVAARFPERPGPSLHLWRIDLTNPPRVGRASTLLSADEHERAGRLRSAAGRARFERSRMALRAILAGYLDTPPEELVFDYGESGKPSLPPARASTPGEPTLWFNLSHSEDLALCAVGESGEVGVDIESVRALSDFKRLAQRHFSPAELRHWSASTGDDALLEFFRIWTRKEAMLKAAGFGLSRPLERVDTLEGILEDVAYWLLDVRPGEGFTGAVACANVPSEVLRWSWEAV